MNLDVVGNFMSDRKIFYSPFNTTVNFIVAIGGLILLIILATQIHTTAAILFIIVLLAIGGQAMFMFIKSFFLFVSKKPALILTNECFIDNSMSIRIPWIDINAVSIYKFNGRAFLAFDLVDNSIIYRQVLNPMQNIFLRLNAALTKKSFMTSLSFLKGDNAGIFETVDSYHQTVVKKG